MSRDRSGDKSSSSSKYPGGRELKITDPDGRLRCLAASASDVEINPNIAPTMYYRSGTGMIRLATQYKNQGELQKAYVLYMKFITLFVEKIVKHPLYKSVPLADRAKNQQILKQIFPITEELKKKILQQFKDDARKFIADEEERKLRIEEDEKRLKNIEKINERLADNNRKDNDDDDDDVKLPVVDSSNFYFDYDKKSDETTIMQFDDQATPAFDRSLKPSTISSHRFSLSDLILPKKLISEFLRLSNGNTLSNKETCGILAGKIGKNQLFVTHLLIPHQSGSPDSCLTHNEEDIFDYQDQHSLITLGWIHTHPTQTAFLSSVDLHTHCAYQLMLSEAIAVVCAPKYDETGFFMLTPEHGLNFIAHCRESGFHPHPNEKTLYTNADHCKLDATIDVTIVDLRK